VLSAKISKLLLFFILTAWSYVGFAQGNNGKISGRITDANTGEVVDYAVVAVLKLGTDDVIKGTSSSNGGYFLIANLPLGTYSVRITYIGYDRQLIESVDLDTDDPDIDLGVIKFKPQNSMLAGVTITEKKPQVEVNADQITYNVGQSLQAEGAVATDILKNVPMVNVDIDGKVTIAGKRNTRVFIDGKPSDYMTSNITDLLNVLPSDAIEKIEVIHNPPAKYSADGEGIINIVLKKGAKVGLNGTLSLNGGTLGTYTANSYASYRSKGLSLIGNYAFSRGNSIGNSSSLRQNLFADTTFYRNQYNNRSSFNNGHHVRGSANWDIDSTQNLRFSANYNISNANGGSSSDYFFIDESQVTSGLNKQGNNNNNGSSSYIINADYTWKMSNTGEELSASAVYSNNVFNNDRYLFRNYLNADGTAVVNKNPVEQTFDILGANNNLELKLDYLKPFKAKGSSLGLGLAANLRSNDNDQAVQDLNYKSGQYLPNTGLSNRFNFGQDIYSAYSSLSIRSKRNWLYRASLRAELTRTSFNLSSVATPYSISPYVNLFPNVSVSKLFKQKYSIGLTYSDRINRPREYALNPQIGSSDSLNISFGNPNLKPSLTHQAEMSFGVIQQRWSIYPRLGYSTTSNIIERITTVDVKGVSQSTYGNLASSQYYTFSLNGNYKPTKKIDVNLGATIGRMIYQSNGISKISRNGNSFQSKGSVFIELPKKLAFEGNLNYYNNTSAQGRNAGSVTSGFGLRKVMFKNKVRLRVMATNPFGQTNTSIYTEGENFIRQDFSTQNTRNFSMILSYNFTRVNNAARGGR
jgi:hypothetical protein